MISVYSLVASDNFGSSLDRFGCRGQTSWLLGILLLVSFALFGLCSLCVSSSSDSFWIAKITSVGYYRIISRGEQLEKFVSLKLTRTHRKKNSLRLTGAQKNFWGSLGLIGAEKGSPCKNKPAKFLGDSKKGYKIIMAHLKKSLGY